jgi:nucleoside-diphosphate-sugar epimerase
LPGVLGVNARSVWLTNLIRKLIQHEPLELFNRQGFFNNAVWVDDLARFCIHLLFSPDSKRHQTFVLAAGSSLTIEEIFTYVKTTVMSTSVAQWKENVAGGFSIDCSSAISAGYKPVSLEEMLSLQIAIERNLSSA